MTPAYPYLSVPTLTAYLRQVGHEVIQLDLNLQAWQDLLVPERLREAYVGLTQTGYTPRARWLLRNAHGCAEGIGWALEVMRGEYGAPPETDTYLRAALVIRTSLNLLSYGFNAHWTADSYVLPDVGVSSLRAVEVAADPARNLFEQVFSPAADTIKWSGAELVGISVAYDSQLVPTLALARILKRSSPAVPIILGGSYLTHLNMEAGNLLKHCPWIDGIVLFQGERPLLEVIDALTARRGFKGVPNLLWRNVDGRIEWNGIGTAATLERLPPPDFSDLLPLSKYLSPLPTLPVLASRGCYHGKCAFCSHHFSFDGRFAHRPVQAVLVEVSRDINLGARCIYMVDEAVSPRIMLELARAVTTEGWDVIWLAETRAEPSFTANVARELYNGGCRLISFGVESANQRVLNLMGKGTNLSQVRTVLHNTHAASILTAVTCFVGFPGETSSEAMETLRFILETPDIDLFGLGPYAVAKHSPIHQEPGRYGVGVMVNPGDDLAVYFDHEVDGGISSGEARKIVGAFWRRQDVRPHKMKVDLTLTRSHLAMLNPEDIRYGRLGLEEWTDSR